MKKFIFISALCILCASSFSQDTTKSSSLYISTTLSQVAVIRITGSDTSYNNAMSIAPAIKFRGRSGWGLSYSPAIVKSASGSGIYMQTVSGGYEKSGKNFDLSFNYSHFFFSKNTDVPYTPINNELYFSTSYTTSWLQPMIATSIGFGKNTAGGTSSAYDVGLVAGISHDFGFENPGPFTYIDLTPSLMVNAGTNEYFSFLTASRYLSQTSKYSSYVKKSGKGTSVLPGFAARNLELDLETSFEIGSFSIEPVAAVYFPLTGVEKSMDGYWQVVLKYRVK